MKIRNAVIAILLLAAIIGLYYLAPRCIRVSSKPASGVFAGMSYEQLYSLYPRDTARTYRLYGQQEWITYNKKTCCGINDDLVTFYIRDGKLMQWQINNRDEVATEYLSEFCSQLFITTYNKIYRAIKNVLVKVPQDVFLTVTQRNKPTVFTEYHYTGNGRFANSSDIYFLEGDPPAFTDGVWIVKLSTELSDTKSQEEIETIIAHELAHRYLGHKHRQGVVTIEKEANHLVLQWGFTEGLKKTGSS